jgi:hypothetical protein
MGVLSRRTIGEVERYADWMVCPLPDFRQWITKRLCIDRTGAWQMAAYIQPFL